MVDQRGEIHDVDQALIAPEVSFAEAVDLLMFYPAALDHIHQIGYVDVSFGVTIEIAYNAFAAAFNYRSSEAVGTVESWSVHVTIQATP